MSYINVEYNLKKDVAKVWEKHNGKRVLKEIKPPSYFYIKDKDGEYVSVYDEPLRKIEFKSYNDMRYGVKNYTNRYESDLQPIERLLSDYYKNGDKPQLNIFFIDIETDYDRGIGYARPAYPYAPINAITLYDKTNKEYITLAIPSKKFKNQEVSEEIKSKTKLYLFDNDADLLKKFYEVIKPADVLSGWNSDFFDIPYIVKRTEKVLGKEWASKIAFEESEIKYEEKQLKLFKNSNKKALYIKSHSRVFLDYLLLYKKFSFVNLVSYSLDSVSSVETKIEKLKYDGDLHSLYRDDFNLFLKYNIRDVECLVEIDRKRDFITLANNMAHKNAVLFSDVFGSVRIIETGVLLELHKINKIANDKANVVSNIDDIEIEEKAEGAIVLSPKKGLHNELAAVDLNSLYPNTICTVNISPEKMIGQFLNEEDDYLEIIKKSNKVLTIRLNDGNVMEMPAHDWYGVFEELKWAISGHGTVFDQSRGVGIIPSTLANWYKLRKQYQAEKAKYEDLLYKESKKENPDSKYIEELEELISKWDIEQHTMKIFLNSAYGALLNKYFRFGRSELGSSVTGSSRQITKFMIETIATYIDGKHTPLIKQKVKEGKEIKNVYTIDTNSIIYSDTDSCYFKVPFKDIDEAVKYSDTLCDYVNSQFNDFVKNNFLCQPNFLNFIKAGREIVANKGLFIEKKKYICQVVDKEGKRIPQNSPKRFKMQGVEIKKTDTPKKIQDMISHVIELIFNEASYDEISNYILDFKTSFKNEKENILAYGIPKKISEYDEYYEAYKNKVKKVIPQNVRSAINFNEVLSILEDTSYNEIGAGDGIRILYLKHNDMGIETIGIPADETKLPIWFNEHFKVDMRKTSEKLIQNKLEIFFKPIGWEVPTYNGKAKKEMYIY